MNGKVSQAGEQESGHENRTNEVGRRRFLQAAGGVVGASIGAVSSTGRAHTPSFVTVGMDNGEFAMQPVGLHLAHPGDTVVFEAGDGAPHTTTAYEDRIPDDATPWDSGILAAGDTFEVTLDVPGTYDYYCDPHRAQGQVGRVVVGQPGGPAEETAIPDSPATGSVPPGDVIEEEGEVSYPFEQSSDAVLPGFGIGTAVVSVGAAGYLLARRRGDRE